MSNYAGIVVNQESIQLDRVFTYKIPEMLRGNVGIGYRVKVPFGIRNKPIDGFIVEIYEEVHGIKNLKSILENCEEFPVLSEENIAMILWMKEKYLATYLECIKLIIPTGITRGMKRKYEDLLFIGTALHSKYQKTPYKEIYGFVQEYQGKYNKNQLNKMKGFSLSSINTMIKHGFLQLDKREITRYSEKEYEFYGEKELNTDQRDIVQKIVTSFKKKFILHGITGSGKTEIYMNLVKHMLLLNKDSIILVPEIALTPQMVERFKGRFGSSVSVFHSKLSDGERYDEWLRVKEGKVKIAVGARSALFLPFQNLGLIVIDEEHEGSYKSESDPKYNAREIAEKKCELGNCKLILGSATPSIETYYGFEKGEVELLNLLHRADGAKLPTTEVVDMREELLQNNRSIFSRRLYEEITNSLEKKEQIILFLNRRGFSTFVSCRQCGYVFKCDNCDVSLTHHFNKELLVCHYCGKTEKMPSICPKCGSRYVKYFGVGTEKVEQEIKRYFPQARTLRMDFDTTRSKNSYEEIYTTFKEKRADVLVGTQMIAKGLDFKDVTLVGVIAADLSLNLPDYRAAERTFQLITQVAGRAGRGEKEGKVIVQTYTPEHFAIQFAANHDYESFYREELKIRENMNYPPFSQLFCINFTSKSEEMLIKCIQNVAINLKLLVEKNDKINMLGPCPCGVYKIKEQYRWQILFKGNIDIEIANKIKEKVYELSKNVYNEIRVSMDLNPNSLL